MTIDNEIIEILEELGHTCEWWIGDQEMLFWETGCDQTFQFFDGGPKYNGFRFCPYCGGIIEELSDE